MVFSYQLLAPECSEDDANQAFLEYICGTPEIWPECQAFAVSTIFYTIVERFI